MRGVTSGETGNLEGTRGRVFKDLAARDPPTRSEEEPPSSVRLVGPTATATTAGRDTPRLGTPGISAIATKENSLPPTGPARITPKEMTTDRAGRQESENQLGLGDRGGLLWGPSSRRLQPAREVADQQADHGHEIALLGKDLDHREGVADRSSGRKVAETGGRQDGEADVDAISLAPLVC